MSGTIDWLLEQAKGAGPLVAVAAVITVVILWRALTQERKATRTLAREATRALLANARAMAKLAAMIERNNGR